MTPEVLSSIVAILISLSASYLPGSSAWFEALDGSFKRLLMLALICAASAISKDCDPHIDLHYLVSPTIKFPVNSQHTNLFGGRYCLFRQISFHALTLCIPRTLMILGSS